MDRSTETRDFYDRFSDDVLLEDFRRWNLRHQDIKRLCKEFVPRRARVLEIGCGVGIISRYLQTLDCRVVGVDLSPKNIEIAKAYVGSDRCEFKVIDVMEQTGDLEVCGVFDVVLLPDVIEHIPKDKHGDLFAVIERQLSKSGRILLTFPSPEYQEYLRANEPEHLQVVDETVELEEILNATSLALLYFSSRDVWHKNQYNHVVLTADRSYGVVPLEMSRLDSLSYRFRKRWWRLRNRLFLRKLKK
ncbi:MAG: class I SAM-dependent methyltransferase [Candidatus Latescibacterota bacterium]|nr:MAG: class I SAM-dependent methyltransferase [Candidatus Latescibacterota bacterium]